MSTIKLGDELGMLWQELLGDIDAAIAFTVGFIVAFVILHIKTNISDYVVFIYIGLLYFLIRMVLSLLKLCIIDLIKKWTK